MKLVVFGPDRRVGLVDQSRILDLWAAAVHVGWGDERAGVFRTLLQLIESGDRGLDDAAALSERFKRNDYPGLVTELADTSLHAPYPGRRFALAGFNNAVHVANYYTHRGKPTTADGIRTQLRAGPASGFWSVADPVGPGSEIPVPRAANGLFDYEGEVAIVLGKGGKRLRGEDFNTHVWGTVLVIDWSVRADSVTLPWYKHKNFDCSKSLGPWVSVGEIDPMRSVVETRVNGEVRQKFVNGEDMIFSYPELLEQVSEDLTLKPGDLLAGGTGAGTALDSTPVGADGSVPLDRFLKPGDTVEVKSPELGSLDAHIVAGG